MIVIRFALGFHKVDDLELWEIMCAPIQRNYGLLSLATQKTVDCLPLSLFFFSSFSFSVNSFIHTVASFVHLEQKGPANFMKNYIKPDLLLLLLHIPLLFLSYFSFCPALSCPGLSRPVFHSSCRCVLSFFPAAT